MADWSIGDTVLLFMEVYSVTKYDKKTNILYL